ncbi:hypothetical protein HDU96_008155 [Phlyctochytrium bullatum]|nr:hypothetical protein HDU96_008155 [Phlyctochytrium bullatum]
MVAATSVFCVRSRSPKRLSVGAHAPTSAINVATTGPRMNARKRMSMHSNDGHSISSHGSVTAFVDPAVVGPRGVHHHH